MVVSATNYFFFQHNLITCTDSVPFPSSFCYIIGPPALYIDELLGLVVYQEISTFGEDRAHTAFGGVQSIGLHLVVAVA